VGNQFHRERDARAVDATLSTIGAGWKPILLSRLIETPSTLSSLRSAMPDALATALVHELKELIDAGIVCVNGADSPWEMYSVTDYGRTLAPALECMRRWGRTHLTRLG
jgi:DNA-binding HxlR family transcriptional regulator